MKRDRSSPELGTSFLDLISCGLGGGMLLLFVMVAILGSGGVGQVPNEALVDVKRAAADRLTLVLGFSGPVACNQFSFTVIRGPQPECRAGSAVGISGASHVLIIDLSQMTHSQGMTTVNVSSEDAFGIPCWKSARLVKPSAVEQMEAPSGVCSVTVDGSGDGATIRVP